LFSSGPFDAEPWAGRYPQYAGELRQFVPAIEALLRFRNEAQAAAWRSTTGRRLKIAERERVHPRSGRL
jgi:hypothetical protein